MEAMSRIGSISARSALDFCDAFLSLNIRQRESFILHMNKSQCEKVRCCTYNVLLNSSITLNNTDRAYLRKYQDILKLVASRRVSLSEKRGLLAKRTNVIARVLKVASEYIKSNNSSSKSVDRKNIQDSDSSSQETVILDDSNQPQSNETLPNITTDKSKSTEANQKVEIIPSKVEHDQSIKQNVDSSQSSSSSSDDGLDVSSPTSNSTTESDLTSSSDNSP